MWRGGKNRASGWNAYIVHTEMKMPASKATSGTETNKQRL